MLWTSQKLNVTNLKKMIFFFIVLFIHFISFVFCPNFISFHPVQSPLKSLNTPTTQAPLLGVFMGRSRLGAQLAHDLI